MHSTKRTHRRVVHTVCHPHFAQSIFPLPLFFKRFAPSFPSTMPVFTQTLTVSAPVFAVPKGAAPRKRKFSTLSDLVAQDTEFAVPNSPAPKKGKILGSTSPRPLPRILRRAQKPALKSVITFAVPRNPPPQYVISPKFFKDIKGKMRSLTGIMSHPRASIPDNSQVIIRLLNFLTTIVSTPNPIATARSLETHERRLKLIKEMEEMIIRSVIKGEDVREVEKEIESRENHI